MQLADIHTLFDYNYWANWRILTTTQALNAEELAAPNSYPCGTLRDTLIHILTAERNWLYRWQGRQPRPPLTAEDLPTLDALTAQWRQDEAEVRSYLASLTDDDLHRRVTYVLGDGTQLTDVRWTVMAHVVNHGTQHRSEAAQMLTDFGHSPRDLDVLLFLHWHEL